MVRMSPIFPDPSRDPKLGDALRRLEGAPPDDDDRVRRRIMDAARPALATLRAPARPWWGWLSGWVRVAVPIALAAGLAAVLLLPGQADIVTDDTTTALAGADSTIVLAAFTGSGAGNQLATHLIAPEAGDWLLAQALDQ